jgi:hypothetical protein
MKIYVNDCLSRSNAQDSVYAVESQPFFELPEEMSGNPPSFSVAGAKDLVAEIKDGKHEDDVMMTVNEHVILVIMKAIRTNVISSDSVQLMILNHDKKTWFEMGFDADGEFTEEWPRGFYEERLELLL